MSALDIPHVPPQDWNEDAVQRFLTSIGLLELVPVFAQHEVTGTVLLSLTEADLQQSLGVQKFGPRRRLALAVAELKEHGSSRPCQASSQSRMPRAVVGRSTVPAVEPPVHHVAPDTVQRPNAIHAAVAESPLRIRREVGTPNVLCPERLASTVSPLRLRDTGAINPSAGVTIKQPNVSAGAQRGQPCCSPMRQRPVSPMPPQILSGPAIGPVVSPARAHLGRVNSGDPPSGPLWTVLPRDPRGEGTLEAKVAMALSAVVSPAISLPTSPPISPPGSRPASPIRLQRTICGDASAAVAASAASAAANAVTRGMSAKNPDSSAVVSARAGVSVLRDSTTGTVLAHEFLNSARVANSVGFGSEAVTALNGCERDDSNVPFVARDVGSVPCFLPDSHYPAEFAPNELMRTAVVVEPAPTHSSEDLQVASSKSCSVASLGADACATGMPEIVPPTVLFVGASSMPSSVPDLISSLPHPRLPADVVASLRAARSAKSSAAPTNSSRPSSEVSTTPASAPTSQQAPDVSTVAPTSESGSTFELQGDASKGSELSEQGTPAEVNAANVDAVRVALPPIEWFRSDLGSSPSDVPSAPCAFPQEIESTSQWTPICPSSEILAEETAGFPEVGRSRDCQDRVASPPPDQVAGSIRGLSSWEQRKLEFSIAPVNVVAAPGQEEAALVAVRAQILSGLLAAAGGALDIALPADVRRRALDNWGDRQASHHRQARAWVVSQVLASPGKTTARDSAHLRALARDVDTHILAVSAQGGAQHVGSRPSAHALPAASDRLELLGAYVDLLKKNVFEDLAAQPAAVEIAFGSSAAVGMDVQRPAEIACAMIGRLAEAIMKRLGAPADRPRPASSARGGSPSTLRNASPSTLRAGSLEPLRPPSRQALAVPKPRAAAVTPRALAPGRGRGLGSSLRISRQPAA